MAPGLQHSTLENVQQAKNAVFDPLSSIWDVLRGYRQTVWMQQHQLGPLYRFSGVQRIHGGFVQPFT